MTGKNERICYFWIVGIADHVWTLEEIVGLLA
jgi:hypothetical protein